MKRLIIIAVVVAIAAVILNDAGRLSRARYDLSSATNDITDEIADVAASMSREKAAMQAANLGQMRGIKVYQYDQNGQGIEIWTEKNVDGTWVLGRYAAWMGGKPLNTVYVVRDYASSVYR